MAQAAGGEAPAAPGAGRSSGRRRRHADDGAPGAPCRSRGPAAWPCRERISGSGSGAAGRRRGSPARPGSWRTATRSAAASQGCTGNGGAAAIQPEAPLPVPVPPLAQNRQPVPSAVMRPVHQRAPGRISGAAHRKTTPPGVPSAASAPAKFRQHVGQPPGREAVHGLFPPSDTGG